MENRAFLRTTFNAQAELYNSVRPHYPEELFESLIKITQLPADASLLEIGPGTGQATAPLAKRGYKITAIELGDALADVARRELTNYHNVQVITGSFEGINISAESFDLVFAATSFHWIKPESRFTKSHRLLKNGGYLAIIHTNHLTDLSNETFYSATQPIYEKYQYNKNEFDSTRPPALSMTDLKAVPMDEELFEPIFSKAFPSIIQYNADEYTRLVGTYSPTLSMSQENKIAF